MSPTAAHVLYEDNHLLALLKPGGMLTMGDDTGDRSMVDVARDYLREKYQKPGNIFVGVVHRLDRPVSGVLLFARTSKAAARLSDQFRQGTVRKIYRAITEGSVAQPAAELRDWLVKDRNTNVVQTCSPQTPGAQECRLLYRVVSRDRQRLHLDVEPITGRSHQIRVQLASRGMIIVGDVKYGSKTQLGHRLSLHAHTLEFDHPTRAERMTIQAPVPHDLC